MLANGIEGGTQEVCIADAGDLDGVLESKEDPFAGPLFRVHLQQVLPLVEHLAFGHLIDLPPGQHTRERALAGAVGPHDRMDLAGVDLEADASKNYFVLDFGVKIENG